MFVDSHCHLHHIDYNSLNSNESDVVKLAVDSGVEHMLCVATMLSEYEDLISIANRHKNITASIGVHPNEVDPNFTADKLYNLTKDKNIVAIGETGLDYFRTEGKEAILLQQEKFRDHIRVAIKANLPIIVHTRMAKEDTLRILQEEQASKIRGVIHCFTEDLDMAKRCIDLGFLISFSGIVSFKNSIELKNIAKALNLKDMLIETDCPYLAPTPMRGKINQPAYVKYVAQTIADLKGIDIMEVGRVTSENYYSIFQRG